MGEDQKDPPQIVLRITTIQNENGVCGVLVYREGFPEDWLTRMPPADIIEGANKPERKPEIMMRTFPIGMVLAYFADLFARDLAGELMSLTARQWPPGTFPSYEEATATLPEKHVRDIVEYQVTPEHGTYDPACECGVCVAISHGLKTRAERTERN